MTWLIIDSDTKEIYANVTDLVNRYPDPRAVAKKTVEEMNRGMLETGGEPCFEAVEAPDNVTYILNQQEHELEAQTKEEAYAVTQFLNEGLGSTVYEMHPSAPSQNVVYLCNRK